MWQGSHGEPCHRSGQNPGQIARLFIKTAAWMYSTVATVSNNAIFVKEEDIGTYTIKAVDDPRTLNKILYLRPPANTLSLNDLVSLWEKKIGKTLEKIYVLEEQLLKNIEEAPIPLKINLSIGHSVFVKGDHTNFEIEPSFGVEASQLYPDVKYTTVDEILDQFV